MYLKDLDMAQRIAAAVAERGGDTYFVGGYVRDLLLGRENKDIDIEVHGVSPKVLEAVLDSLGDRMEIGASFGIYGLAGYSLDIAMPRKETKTGGGHKDFDVFVDPHIGTLAAAKRRDFTFNALMQNVLTGEIIDGFGGRADLEKGIIRHVDDASFAEDPLRVLRAAQFAARMGFFVAEETVRLCRGMDLSTLSKERVFGELEKALLKAKTPSVFFKVLREMGQLSLWFPELEGLIGVPQNPKYHAEGDAWTHTMMVIDSAATLREQAAEPLMFMLSAVVHDFGKALCTVETGGAIHAYKHETEGLPLVTDFIKRLTNNKAILAYTRNMTEYHMKPNILAANKSKISVTNRMFDRSCDPEGLLLLSEADGLGKIPPSRDNEKAAFLKERLAIYREYMSRPHVSGADLLKAGVPQDNKFGKYLGYAHKLRLAGVDKETALKETLGFIRSLNS